jgi:glycosyltransferase involved in cell wall biosynthesis
LEDFEVICVNDGSTDKSGDILARYHRQHPEEMIVLSQANAGVSSARNTGLARAQGDFVYFLDSDDYLLSGTLKTMYEFASSQNLDLAVFNARLSEDNCYFRSGFDLPPSTGAVFLKRFYKQDGHFFPTPVFMYLYRLAFLREHGLEFKHGRLHEDNEFTSRALYFAQRCALRNVPVCFYVTSREGSITSKATAVRFQHILQNFRDLFSFFSRHPIDPIFLESLITQFLFCVQSAKRNGFSLKEIGMRPSDLLKLALISPIYIGFRIRKFSRKWNSARSERRQ